MNLRKYDDLLNAMDEMYRRRALSREGQIIIAGEGAAEELGLPGPGTWRLTKDGPVRVEEQS